VRRYWGGRTSDAGGATAGISVTGSGAPGSCERGAEHRGRERCGGAEPDGEHHDQRSGSGAGDAWSDGGPPSEVTGTVDGTAGAGTLTVNTGTAALTFSSAIGSTQTLTAVTVTNSGALSSTTR